MNLIRRSHRSITKPRRLIDSGCISRTVISKLYDNVTHWECYYYGVRLSIDKHIISGFESKPYYRRVMLDELILTMNI